MEECRSSNEKINLKQFNINIKGFEKWKKENQFIDEKNLFNLKDNLSKWKTIIIKEKDYQNTKQIKLNTLIIWLNENKKIPSQYIESEKRYRKLLWKFFELFKNKNLSENMIVQLERCETFFNWYNNKTVHKTEEEKLLEWRKLVVWINEHKKIPSINEPYFSTYKYLQRICNGTTNRKITKTMEIFFEENQDFYLQIMNQNNSKEAQFERMFNQTKISCEKMNTTHLMVKECKNLQRLYINTELKNGGRVFMQERLREKILLDNCLTFQIWFDDYCNRKQIENPRSKELIHLQNNL